MSAHPVPTFNEMKVVFEMILKALLFYHISNVNALNRASERVTLSKAKIFGIPGHIHPIRKASSMQASHRQHVVNEDIH